MKKRNSKSFLMLIFSVLLFTCFYSCEKSGKLDGTTWKSGAFEAESTDLQKPGVLQIEEMTISFKKESADLQFIIKDKGKVSGTTTYTYEENYLLIQASYGDLGIVAERSWGGIVDGKKISIVMFGQQVEFPRK
jgi:hypothetical protein